jgi:hypothetical protein
MFKLNIFKKSLDYRSLEKECNCCSEKYDKNSLVKDTSYFNGNKRMCYNCQDIMNKIIDKYSLKHGKITSSDKEYLSNHLLKFVSKKMIYN